MDRQLLALKKKFETAGIRQAWLHSSSVLAAVSGGGDSVALLWLLRQFYGGKLFVAHIDHSTRNGASQKDANFVAELCKAWDIPCFIKTVDAEKERGQGESFEMAGRRIRYAFFEETANEQKIEFIALGHNLDDLVETQLLNLFRGTGIEGLRGIPETRGKIVRPLIDFRRSELRELLRANNVPWREDESNAETIYNRNKIRNFIVPWIKENLNENFEISMSGLAREAQEYINRRAFFCEKLLSEISTNTDFLAAWDAKRTRKYSLFEISDLLRTQGKKLDLPVLDRRRTEQLAQLIMRGGRWRFQWAFDVEVCRVNGNILWLNRTEAEQIFLRNKR